MDIAIFLVKGQRDQFDVRMLPLDVGDGIDATGSRHREIHQYDVGLQRGNTADRGPSVRRSTHDLESGFGCQQGLETVAHDRVIIDDHYFMCSSIQCRVV